jgi:hypothetical protein
MPIKRRAAGPSLVRRDTCPLPSKVRHPSSLPPDLRQQLPLATRDLLLLVVLRSTIDNDKCRVEMPQVG